MEGVIIAFLVLVGAVCVFSVLVVTWEIVREARGKNAPQPAAPAVATTDAPAEPAAQTDATTDAPTESDARTAATTDAPTAAPPAEGQRIVSGDVVVFKPGEEETLEERYLALSPAYKSYYDEIVKYAANVENAKRIKTERYEEYKVGSMRIVRLRIRRDVVVGEFYLVNSSFRNYATENKLRVKPAPTVIRLTDETAVAAGKQSIDIAVRGIEEEKEYKKQLRRERRRAARQADKAQ